MEPIILILILIFIILLAIYNGLIKKRNAVKQSRSSIDVYLTQRFDLIPNLVECVKGYAKHEKEVFENITKLRTEYNETKNLDKASELNNKINNLLVIGENYPELKSSENFLNLQKNLSKMEDQLQAARRLYNMDVTTYNTSLQMFPSNIIATIFRFKEETLFKIEPEKTENIKIDL
ncbi:MAG: LemA family protein [Clostridia bacterium]|nr:LemA family protein [Clostridia bacterium]